MIARRRQVRLNPQRTERGVVTLPTIPTDLRMSNWSILRILKIGKLMTGR